MSRKRSKEVGGKTLGGKRREFSRTEIMYRKMLGRMLVDLCNVSESQCEELRRIYSGNQYLSRQELLYVNTADKSILKAASLLRRLGNHLEQS